MPVFGPSSHSPASLSSSAGRDSGLIVFPRVAWPSHDNISSSSSCSAATMPDRGASCNPVSPPHFLIGQATLDQAHSVPVRQVLVGEEELADTCITSCGFLIIFTEWKVCGQYLHIRLVVRC